MEKQIKIRINSQLQQLCEVLRTSPEEVLQQFADNLSLDYKHTSGSDEREMAVSYFMRCGYGMHLFEFHEVDNMFAELNNIRSAFNRYGNEKEQEYLEERNNQYNELFNHLRELKRIKLQKTNEGHTNH